MLVLMRGREDRHKQRLVLEVVVVQHREKMISLIWVPHFLKIMSDWVCREY